MRFKINIIKSSILILFTYFISNVNVIASSNSDASFEFVDQDSITLVSNSREMSVKLLLESTSENFGEQLHDYSMTCHQNLVTKKISCRTSEEMLDTLEEGAKLRKILIEKNGTTFLNMVFKSSQNGAITGAIVGGTLGAILVGQAAYTYAYNTSYGQSGRIHSFLDRFPEGNLAVTNSLPEIILGHTISSTIMTATNRIIRFLAPSASVANKQFSVLLIGGAIKWAFAGAAVGAVAGPAFLINSPQEIGQLTLTLATPGNGK